ncbi:MAG TPA: hypothetical protein VGA40_00470, partial [Candidatus Acidoferrales bacterium]
GALAFAFTQVISASFRPASFPPRVNEERQPDIDVVAGSSSEAVMCWPKGQRYRLAVSAGTERLYGASILAVDKSGHSS